jgi:hypothetical protein
LYPSLASANLPITILEFGGAVVPESKAVADAVARPLPRLGARVAS